MSIVTLLPQICVVLPDVVSGKEISGKLHIVELASGIRAGSAHLLVFPLELYCFRTQMFLLLLQCRTTMVFPPFPLMTLSLIARYLLLRSWRVWSGVCTRLCVYSVYSVMFLCVPLLGTRCGSRIPSPSVMDGYTYGLSYGHSKLTTMLQVTPLAGNV